jgi:hypothetical protein
MADLGTINGFGRATHFRDQIDSTRYELVSVGELKSSNPWYAYLRNGSGFEEVEG